LALGLNHTFDKKTNKHLDELLLSEWYFQAYYFWLTALFVERKSILISYAGNYEPPFGGYIKWCSSVPLLFELF